MQLELRARIINLQLMQTRNLIIGIVSGVALAAGLMVAIKTFHAPAASVKSATVLPTTMELPDFALVDHHGKPADKSFFEGQWDLVFFGFTHCPDVCPMTLQVLRAAKSKLVADGFEAVPRIVLVSVDPERDTPDQLAAYIAAFGDDNAGLTGSLAELRKLTSGLGIFFEKSLQGGDDYGVDHSAVVLVVDAQGRFHALFSSPHRIEDYVHDIPLLVSR